MSVSALEANHLRWLMCPACHQSLKMESGAVDCIGCGRRFPIVDGIPVLLVTRAV
jgi:uncharacterized protein YbaR (Trm112 family)